MEILDGHFRHILLYYFRKGKNAVQARKKLYDVYGEKSLTERQCQNLMPRCNKGLSVRNSSNVTSRLPNEQSTRNDLKKIPSHFLEKTKTFLYLLFLRALFIYRDKK